MFRAHVVIIRRSKLHYIYRCDDTRGCVIQFWPPDDEHLCSKHVEAWNKTYCKTKFCASSWLNTEINLYLLYCAALSSMSLFRSVCKFQGQKFLWSNMFVKHWHRARTDLSSQQRYTVDISDCLCVRCNDHFIVLHWCPWSVTCRNSNRTRGSQVLSLCKFNLHVVHI